jgi:hypothetical protein
MVPTEWSTRILALAGNLKAGREVTTQDDGVSQTATVKAGVTLVDTAKVPNPVPLKPYRTFIEVNQPESSFVLRLKQGYRENELPSIALFEADGGAWRLEAIQSIAQYLRTALPELKILA